MEPSIRYARTADGVSIAYSVVGSGTPLVRVTSVLWNHAEAWWRIEPYRRMAERLAERNTFITYDARGTGLSQKGTEDFRLQARLFDLEAVLNALSIERCTLISHQIGAMAAVAYAAQRPDRVARLVLVNPLVRGLDWTQVPVQRARESFRAMAEHVWEPYRMAIAIQITDLSDAKLLPQIVQVMDEAFTPAAIHLHSEQIEHIDVSELLPKVTMPTLVAIGRDAPGAELSREVATLVPDARVASIDGGWRLWMSGAAAEVVEAFLAEGREAEPAVGQPLPSGLRIILFTDIEEHTAMMQRLGDTKGREVLRTHERITREALRAHGGTEVKTMGDGFMAWFGSASRALECAIALQKAFAAHNETAEVPTRVRTGLNAGEPIAEENDLFGTAVILAARIAAQAQGGQILTSDVVRQLAAGKGFQFDNRGEAVLRGFEEAVRLYEVQWKGPA